MSNVINRFLKYVSFDTQSMEDQEQIPSTKKQFALADYLKGEMIALGMEDVRRDEHGYVYGMIPASKGREAEHALGFIAHMDTSPDASGANVHTRIVEKDGEEIIETDHTTLLGADDKAGIAEIMTMAELLLNDAKQAADANTEPLLTHPKICIGFTPDEEVGRGADLFDVEGFGADIAFTVDGGELGEIEYENFNAASARVLIHGKNIHPGNAKDVMKNACRIGAEFDAMIPQSERPEATENYEGFYHLTDFCGDVTEAKLNYILRDHDAQKLEEKKEMMRAAAAFINHKYGSKSEGNSNSDSQAEAQMICEVIIKDSYRNMREKIEDGHMNMIESAIAAFEKCGAVPKVLPIRGGTDGARLSFMGLPCPNLSTGGINFHSVDEYIPVKSLEIMVEVLTELAKCGGERV